MERSRSPEGKGGARGDTELSSSGAPRALEERRNLSSSLPFSSDSLSPSLSLSLSLICAVIFFVLFCEPLADGVTLNNDGRSLQTAPPVLVDNFPVKALEFGSITGSAILDG